MKYEVWEYIEYYEEEMIEEFDNYEDAERYFKENCRNYEGNDFIEVRFNGEVLLNWDYEE